MASPSTKTKPAKSRTSSTKKRTPAPKTPSSPKKKTAPKSGATNTAKNAQRKPSAAKGPAQAATIPANDKPPIEHRPVGCPPINDPNDVATVEDRINAFFDECSAGNRKATFCGLALALGYRSRTSLWEHAKANEPISEPINTAMLMIEDRYEGKLDTASSYGAQFALGNRGWKTTQVVETDNPSRAHVYLPDNGRGRS